MVQIQPFFHHDTATFSYVVFDDRTKDTIIIDPVLDFAPETGVISFTSLDKLCGFLDTHNLKPHLVADTHAHADHLSGAYFLAQRLKVPSAIGRGFSSVQAYFATIYNIDLSSYKPAYDILFSDHDEMRFGSLSLKVFLTPGHTPSCSSYLVDDALFCGDALFQPYLGCGRTDFPSGSAKTLYQSITKQIYTLPDHTKIFVGHDYPQQGNEPKAQTSVKESKNCNILIDQSTSEQQFIINRHKRDQGLLPPRLQILALQVNILGGQLPKTNNHYVLTVPLTINNSNQA